jgi:cytochrome c peroxidase
MNSLQITSGKIQKLSALLLAFFIFGCNTENKDELLTENKPVKTNLMLEALNFFKPISSVPYEELPENYQEINNPVHIKSVHFKGNELKVDLGKKLYFDTRLSKNGTISCNSCHNLNTFGVDNLPTSPGDTKEFGGRNSPTVMYDAILGWTSKRCRRTSRNAYFKSN